MAKHETMARPERSLIIAERTRNVRRLLARELDREGWTVTTLGHAADLCRELERRPAPRVVLLDPDLPGLDDATFLARMRNAATHSMILVHAFGTTPPASLATITWATIPRDGDIGELRSTLAHVLGCADNPVRT